MLGKVLILITEDWFALSHFRPLIRCLQRLAGEVVVVTRCSDRAGELRALGVRTIDLDFNRSSMNPMREAATVRRISEILKRERPDAIHLIAMKPIVLGGMAALLHGPLRIAVHMTGLGFLAISNSFRARMARAFAFGIIRRLVGRASSWLLVENPEDLAFLEAGGVAAGRRTTLLGGAGIDPSEFTATPDVGNDPPIAVFAGRMIRSKGVGVLMQAGKTLEVRGVPIGIALYGEFDDGNPETLAPSEVRSWENGSTRRYHGYTSDVREVWRRANIFVLPALSREGMPKALLEAASSGRPLVVTDVPGCRHFVRDGIEGFIVPPGDADALADALAKLADDAALRKRMGDAARARVLSGYTVAAVEADIECAYQRMGVPGGKME